jgi:radical SAM protein (TIGR01212 family)
VLALLENYAKDYLVWIEYGLQSANDETLLLINRGHDYKCFINAVEATKGRGIKICAHVILGLPGEEKKDMLETAEAIAGLGIDGVKIHLLYVVKGTKMESLYLAGKYRCLEQDEYAGLVCDFLELLPEEMVIQRLTGDPHPDELVAPIWSLEKAKTIALIKSTLEKRDSRQGKFAS